jgi:glutaminase
VVRYLLALGTDPRPEDRWGGTPLSDAEGNGYAHIAELLRQAGPDKPEAVAV